MNKHLILLVVCLTMSMELSSTKRPNPRRTTAPKTTRTTTAPPTICPNNEGVCYNGEQCYQFYGYCYFPDCVRTNECPQFHCPWWYACTVDGKFYAEYNTAGGPVHYYSMPSTIEVMETTTPIPTTTSVPNITTYCENNEAVCYNGEQCYKLHAPCYRPECFFNGQCPDYECPWWWACTYNGQMWVNFTIQGPIHYYTFPSTTTTLDTTTPSPTPTPV